MTLTKPIRVKIEHGDAGLWYATSPDIKGLLVAKKTRDACVGAVPDAVRDLAEAAGEPRPGDIELDIQEDFL